MRNNFCLLLVLFFFHGLAATAQAPSPDSQTLQCILFEVRKLRLDLQSTAVTVQRMQLLLYRIRNQREVVDHLRQIHDAAQAAAAQQRSQREYVANQLKLLEEQLGNTQDSNLRQGLEQNTSQHRTWLERLDQAESEVQAKESDSANELRAEQAKLADLEEQLEELDRNLGTVQRASLNNSH